jgi:hypothetical protein
MQRQRDRLDYLKRKRNWYFIRLHILHSELSGERDPSKRCTISKDLRNIKRFMEITNHEISRVPTTPTHREIARVLGTPKGSIDSGIYYLKNAFQKVYSNL